MRINYYDHRLTELDVVTTRIGFHVNEVVDDTIIVYGPYSDV